MLFLQIDMHDLIEFSGNCARKISFLFTWKRNKVSKIKHLAHGDTAHSTGSQLLLPPDSCPSSLYLSDRYKGVC